MKHNSRQLHVGRRGFIRAGIRASVAGSLLSGVPFRWVGGVYADDSPEHPEVRLGIIALTDCSPVVLASEKGFFAKFGLKPTVAKGASWAAIRDSLSNGDLHGTHMLIGLRAADRLHCKGWRASRFGAVGL
jgi:nitrate/nitrite transport system substrate-binding protein